IVMRNCPQYFEALYGVWHAGLCAVPINAKLHVRELAYILENAGARVALATPELAEAMATLPAEIETLAAVVSTDSDDYARLLASEPAAPRIGGPEELAWLFYTSGTTGRPKGAMLTNRSLMAMVMNYFADVDAVGPEDAMIHAAPLSHGSGLYALPHIAKGANNVVPESGGFDPAETVALIGRWPGCSF